MSGAPRLVSSDELKSNPKNLGAHVVLLGAGASLAAFPDGDAKGLRLPLMDDLIGTLGLAPLLRANGVTDEKNNFEALYSRLCADPALVHLRAKLERRIYGYFSELSLPDAPTLYDQLLLSLRAKDAVLTFNWDPFLYDAWVRNRDFGPPPIYFLHGNVRVRHCAEHTERWGDILRCPVCGKATFPSPLLYPVAEKDYESDSFIKMHWNAATTLLKRAFTVTVFGYRAPESDRTAVDMLHSAYMALSNREVGHFEVIVRPESKGVEETWRRFVPTHHLQVRRSFEESWMGRYPRRTCEGIYWPMAHAIPADCFPMPKRTGWKELYEWIESIRKHEEPLR